MKTPGIIISSLTLVGTLGFSMVACADNEESKAIESARVTLDEAIESAEAAEPGYAFDASIDDDSFDSAYEITIATENGVVEVRVNARSGDVMNSRPDDEDVPTRRSMALADIVRAAVSAREGKAYEASCEDDRFDENCEVELVTPNGEIYELIINGTNGDVVESRQERDD